jgi:hypothetical protein
MEDKHPQELSDDCTQEEPEIDAEKDKMRFELIDRGAGHTAVDGLVITAPWYA